MPRLTGKIARERIVMLDIPCPSRETMDAFPALTDLAGAVPDAMGEPGINGAIPAAVLAPALPGARMAGPALTIRNIMQSMLPTLGAMERRSRQADLDAHNLAQPGDVIVIEGIAGKKERNRDVAAGLSIPGVANKAYFRKIAKREA